jgi:hypothetical protein
MKFLILLMLIVPFAFGKDWVEVDRVCKRMNYQDCLLVKAIITVESGNNPLSIGHDGKGSLGLMQIKCSTARTLDRINKRSKIPCKRLFDSHTNVSYGIEYLNYLQNLLNNVQTKEELLSAYNGGYLYHKPTGTYRIKKCNKISRIKKRKCKGNEPFNVEYSRKVIQVYNKIRS